MGSASSVLEVILNDYLKKKLSFEEALKRAADDLKALPGIEEAVGDRATLQKDQVLKRTKLTEVGIARKQDLKEIGWYQGVPDGGVWEALRERMLGSGLADAIGQIDVSTEEIVASMAEPYVDNDRRCGLVIGNVQSGKTANYSAVIAKALDSRYKFVIVLSGIHNNLRKQTQKRLERDLGVLSDSQDWYRLTNADGDFGRAHAGNATAIVAKHNRVLAVVKKNSSRLRNVLSFLRNLDSQTKKNTPFLIIDDESDQATPDSSAGVDDDPTAINRLMRELWAEVRNGTYIGYTATPFANVFMNPNSSERDGLEELYPSDFVKAMPTPSDYFGAERIFGSTMRPERGNDPSSPDVVRMIPNDEVRLISPRGKNAGHAEPPVTNSLETAIRWFIVASAVRRVREQHGEHSTMLIHTTHRVDPALRDAELRLGLSCSHQEECSRG